MDLGLKGKLAVVTGGSVGIGLAVAEAFAAEGANVLITARNEARVVGEARPPVRLHGAAEPAPRGRQGLASVRADALGLADGADAARVREHSVPVTETQA